MVIHCANCEGVVEKCDYSGCSNEFQKGSFIVCQGYGDEHFCSEECFYSRHEAFIETCVERSD